MDFLDGTLCHRRSFDRGTLMSPDDLDPIDRAIYVAFKTMPDGTLCGVHPLMFHWTLVVDIDPIGYRDRYCYATKEGAIRALQEWDGTGDPEGWHRHVNSGRRRNPETGEEWINP